MPCTRLLRIRACYQRFQMFYDRALDDITRPVDDVYSVADWLILLSRQIADGCAGVAGADVDEALRMADHVRLQLIAIVATWPDRLGALDRAALEHARRDVAAAAQALRG